MVQALRVDFPHWSGFSGKGIYREIFFKINKNFSLKEKVYYIMQ
jgi:hypothetical protein